MIPLTMISFVALGIEVFFTPLVSVDVIVKQIESAQHTISLCTFTIDEPEIVMALENAVRRGVKVRVISESPLINSQIPAKIDAESSLFHMKVIVMDEKVLLLGSANFTVHSLFQSFNDFLILEDSDIASAFQYFFDDLWEGRSTGLTLNHPKIFITNLFIADTVLKELSKAKKTLDVAMYALTHPQVWATIKILSSRGVRVRVLIDEWFFRNSDLSKLPFGGMDLRVIKDFTLHSKLFIIDRQAVLTGSANATKSGYTSNAEMLVVIKDKNITRQYNEYFERLWMEGEIP
ncbi:MAG: phospholipase D-like domain-containing protein [Pseudothermotoga sp.]